MPEAFLVAAVRTPIGKYLGELSDQPAPRLGALVAQEAMQRCRLEPAGVEEVIFGHVLQAGVGQNPARQVALRAGLPPTVSAVTVNKVCGSGLQAVMQAAQAIRAGDADVILAGGMESMSQAPFLLAKVRTGWKYGDQMAQDAVVRDGLWCPFENWPMGDAAEHVAELCAVSRADQDAFAAASHRKAAVAWERGAFTAEVLPIPVGSGTKARLFGRDEGVRPETTAERLAQLKPAFRLDGTVTAGNASQLSDGAAALIVASGRAVQQRGWKPLARVVSYGTSGVPPKDIFLAPVPAIKQVLQKARLMVEDIDLFELNEAFASQMIACARELELPEEKVNVNGGGIALGHPIGASGARVLVTLLHALRARKAQHGVASLCLGGGNAVAMVVETV